MASVIITQEELKIFHTIDRRLYSKLIINLRRDPFESMQVMAFFLWLERSGHAPCLVHKLLSLPLTFVSQLTEEVVACLNCIEGDNFLSCEGEDLPLLQSLTGNTVLSLHHFHDNRIALRRGVAQIVNEVCARAFDDILTQAFQNPTFYHSNLTVPFYPNLSPLGFDRVPEILDQNNHPFDSQKEREDMDEKFSQLLIEIDLLVFGDQNKQVQVPEDDRTIFLTFSKGYPISEDELRGFFTTKFGDFIEALHMQEVGPGQQVLFARLVAKSPSIIDVVAEKNSTSKYCINGKHVWARKYVKRNPTRPPRLNPTRPPRLTSFRAH